MARFTIKFTQTVKVLDINNVERDIQIADTTIPPNTCFLENIVTNAKSYGTHIGDGYYDFGNVQDGNYKLYRDINTPVVRWHGSGSEGRYIGDYDPGFEYLLVKVGGTEVIFVDSGGIHIGPSAVIEMNGRRITELGNPEAPADAVNYSTLTAEISAYLPKSGGTMSGNINMDSHRITNLPAPSADEEPTRKGDMNSALGSKVSKSGDEIIAGIKTFSDTVKFAADENVSPMKYPQLSSYVAPSDQKHLVPRKYLVDYVQAYLSGGVSAYQQSPNILRILYSGTPEANRVFRKISDALTNAASYADSTRQIFSVIEGNGISGQLLSNYNKFSPADVHDYCHLAALNRSCEIAVDQDVYSASVLGKVILKNLTINLPAEAATLDMSKFIFDNVTFNCPDTTLSLANSEFRGNCIITAYSLFITNCIGSPFITNVEPVTESYCPAYITTNNKLVLPGNGLLSFSPQNGKIESEIINASSVVQCGKLGIGKEPEHPLDIFLPEGVGDLIINNTGFYNETYYIEVLIGNQKRYIILSDSLPS